MIKRLLNLLVVILRVLLISALIFAASPFVIRVIVDLAYMHRTYTTEAVPQRRVAMIFGARVYRNERPSAMLADRIATGVDLYHAGKVDMLLMTGNRDDSEDEPEAMRRYAMDRGVPDSAIILDGGGVRTYDSCYRAKEMYGITDAIVVTQQFHLDRALMLCNGLGIDAVGVAADYQRPWGYSRYSMTFSLVREFPALTLALWDLIARPEPILGVSLNGSLPIISPDAAAPES